MIRFNGHGKPVKKYGERFLVLLIEGGPARKSAPWSRSSWTPADIYGTYLTRAFTIWRVPSRNAITIYSIFTLSNKFSWSTRHRLLFPKSHAIFQIRSTITSPNGRK